MKRPNITPGPWEPAGDSIISASSPADEPEVCICIIECGGGYEADVKTREANAQAIAAVPDTHKALERALGTLERMADKLESYDVGTVEAIRAALTKAGYTF